MRGHDELARLGSAFNEMAHSLEQSHEELESQNTELEMQAIALEERQEELSEAADEARAQRDELSLIAAQLAEEKRRAELYGSFGDRLAAERDLEALARVALQALVTAAGADVGVLYTESWRDAARWARAAVVGLEPAPLAEYAIAGGEGAGARAVATRDVVHVRSGSTGLRVRTLAGEALVLWELHVPLTIGERAVGIATLGGVSSEAFDEGESLLLTRLAGQAAVALAEGSALAQRGWLSQVNAAVLDGVREGIALVGLDHELVFANAAMEQLAERLSMPIGAAIGARGADLSTAAVDFDAYFAEWETILADGDEPTADELTVAGVVLERFTAPVDDDAGLRIGRLVVLRDVTREREAEQLKTSLMATVSHELRTPLASVLGYAELLRTRRLESSQREEIVGTVHREAKRLSALIDDFLDLQTIEQDRLELVRAAFDVDELLREAITTFRGQSTAHELVFTGSSGDEAWWRSPTAPGSSRSSRTSCPTRSSTRRRAESSACPPPAARASSASRSPTRASASPPPSSPASSRSSSASRARTTRSAAPASGSPWPTRSSRPTTARWASRAPRASARRSGSPSPRPPEPPARATPRSSPRSPARRRHLATRRRASPLAARSAAALAPPRPAAPSPPPSPSPRRHSRWPRPHRASPRGLAALSRHAAGHRRRLSPRRAPRQPPLATRARTRRAHHLAAAPLRRVSHCERASAAARHVRAGPPSLSAPLFAT